MKTKIEVVDSVLKDKQVIKVNYVTREGKNKKILLDMITANLIRQVYDAIEKPEHREKFMSLDWLRIVKFAWKHV